MSESITTLTEVGRIEVGRINDIAIYREPNGVGGHRYWSDAIGGRVAIWDTCLASREELEIAMQVEKEFEDGTRI